MTTQSSAEADPAELAKFSALAHRWWDSKSEFKPLHDLNPLRDALIAQTVGDLRDLPCIDIGCGGGLLTEALAKRGARVTGIDMAEKVLGVAKLHRLESGLDIDYQLISAESKAAQSPGAFSVVTCLEMLEHVPEPSVVVQAAAKLAKPGAWLFFSTLSRTPKAYLMAVLGAEYALRLLPRGTHDYKKFIRPSELSSWVRGAGLQVHAVHGMGYNPFSGRAYWQRDTSVNYLMIARKP